MQPVAAMPNHQPAMGTQPSTETNPRADLGQPARPTTPGEAGAFLTDVQELRRRARQHIANGAVTEGYRANREVVVDLLNQALATELVCVLRYKRHYFMATGIHAEAVAAEFLEHANQEQGHADQLAARIVQLGGEPNFDPQGLVTRSHAEYVPGDSLLEMITEDLVAERIAIDSYSEMIQYIGDKDTTTKRMLESILAVEEEHADDLKSMIELVGEPHDPSRELKSERRPGRM
jgi:bacterioferritin